MTFRRNDPDRLSNYFDGLLRGIGHRGSSFTDVDALTHDEATDRFLFQEFKGQEEPLSKGQAKLLKALARRDFLTVWCVRTRGDGCLEFFDVATRQHDVISVDEYQRRFARWWNNGAQPVAPVKAATPTKPVDAPFGYDLTGSPLPVAPGTSKNIPRDGDPPPKLLTAGDINWGFSR